MSACFHVYKWGGAWGRAMGGLQEACLSVPGFTGDRVFLMVSYMNDIAANGGLVEMIQIKLPVC